MASKRPINWLAIRTDWLAGLHERELARKYRVSERQIYRRRASDAKAGSPWVRPGGGGDSPSDDSSAAASSEAGEASADIRPRLTAMAGGKMSSKSHARRDGESGGYPSPLPSLDYDFDPHNVTDEALAGALRATAMKALADLNAGRIKPGMNQSHADVIKNVVTAAANAIAASRDVAGKKPGIPSTEEDVFDPNGSDEIGYVFEHKIVTERDANAS